MNLCIVFYIYILHMVVCVCVCVCSLLLYVCVCVCRPAYPNLVEYFEQHDVLIEESDMSFSVSAHNGKIEWSSDHPFAQTSNILNPRFIAMLTDIPRFKRHALAYLAQKPHTYNKQHTSSSYYELSLDTFLHTHKYSQYFLDYYIIPQTACIWSCPWKECLLFPVYFFLQFMDNHYLLQIRDRPQWLTCVGRSQQYVKKVTKAYAHRIRVNRKIVKLRVVSGDDDAHGNGDDSSDDSDVKEANNNNNRRRERHTHIHTQRHTHTHTQHRGKFELSDSEGRKYYVHKLIFACPAHTALSILGVYATHQQRKFLSVFKYAKNDVWLHYDKKLMPRRRCGLVCVCVCVCVCVLCVCVRVCVSVYVCV